MSYEYEPYPLGLSDEDDFDLTFDCDAYNSPRGAAPANEGSRDPGSFDRGFSGNMNNENHVDANHRPTAQSWLVQVITSEPLQDPGFGGFQPQNTALTIGNIMHAAGRPSDPVMDLPPRHEHGQAVSPDKSHPFLQSPSFQPSSVQALSYDVSLAFSPPSQQQPAHRNPYTTGRRLSRSDHPLHEDAPVRSMSVSSFHEINNSYWVMRQRLYHGNSGSCTPMGNTQFPVMLVNVSAKDALDPNTLARVLQKPLDPTFEPNPERKGKKGTCRYAYHEYAAGDQRSDTVSAAQSLFGDSSRPSAISVPLKRATVVEKVARGLYTFMGTLKAQSKPLKFNGLDVDYNHLRIVNIFRPTVASMQPTLEILDDFRDLYSHTTRASYATS